MTAYSYLRYSRGHQRRGRSERRQTVSAADYCARKGWTLDDTLYADRGVSAFRGRNAATGALGAFLRDVEAGKVKPGDVLIVESLDRLSRQDIDDAYDLFRGIIRAGVNVVTLDPERHYDKASLKSITGIIEPLVIMARANEESERKSTRGKDVWRHRRRLAGEQKRPTNGACPRWLRYDPAARRFVVIPERAAPLRRMFAMCIDGMGCRQIAGVLNREGVPPWGRLWEIGAVGRILRSRSVMGEYQPKVRGEKGRVNTGAPIPDYYPEVIDPETFWRAQGVLQARSTLKIRGREGRNVANLFTGLMRDATDGSPMLYKHTTAGRYIDSERAWNGEKRGNGFRYRIFEESLLIFLRDDLTLGAADTSARRREREALEAELCACEARLRRTVATMVACDDADVHASLSEVLAQQTRQKKALQEQVERARGEERLDQAAGLQATKSVIVAYYHAREKEEVFGGLLDDLKRETGKKPTPEIREIEDRFRARHWGDLRSQIKNKIRGLIAEIWVLVKAEGWRRKTALVELHFRQGAVKALEITVDPSGEVTRWVIEPPGLKRSPPRGA